MQTFRIFFKVVRRSVLWIILMYLIIFASLALMITSQASAEVNGVQIDADAVEDVKVRAAIFNEDSSELSGHLEEYFSSKVERTEIENDDMAISDALFYAKISYALIIPEGFGEKFGTPDEISLICREKPDSTAGIIFSSMINNYLATASLYLDGTGTIDYAALENDMKISTEMTKQTVSDNGTAFGLHYYYNFASYPLLGILITCTAFVMMSFNEKHLRQRNACAPISSSSSGMQLFAGMAMITAVVYLVFMLLPFIFYPEAANFSTQNMLWMLNCLLFTITSLSIGFFISSFVKKSWVSAISNIIPLGFSFLGGVFVQQNLLSDTVRTISIFNPSYWYVHANNQIASVTLFNAETLTPILLDMAKVIAFAAVFISLTLVLLKKKQTSR